MTDHKYFEQLFNVENFAKESVREWYAQAFPEDGENARSIHPDLTFGDVLLSPQKGDCANDSVVRERVFTEMAAQTKLPYDVFYYGWLNEIDSISEVAEKHFSGERELAIHDFVLDHTSIFCDPQNQQDTHAQNSELQGQDKPSVLKQIRDAEKAPKPPRKTKTADKEKGGAEL